MKLDFCAVCGSTDNLHFHHFIPVKCGGTDDDTNILTLCYEHHMQIHGLRPLINYRELQKQGIEKAKKKGVYAYERRAPKKSPVMHKIAVLLGQGLKAQEIAEKTGCSVATVYNVRSKMKKARASEEQTSLID